MGSDAGLPLGGQIRLMPERGNHRVSHGHGTTEALFGLGEQVEPRHMRDRTALPLGVPGHRMPAATHRQIHEPMIGGMVFHLVNATTVTVEGAESGRILVGLEPERHGLRTAANRSQRRNSWRQPVRAETAETIAQRRVGGIKIHVPQRLGLVFDGVGAQRLARRTGLGQRL